MIIKYAIYNARYNCFYYSISYSERLIRFKKEIDNATTWLALGSAKSRCTEIKNLTNYDIMMETNVLKVPFVDFIQGCQVREVRTKFCLRDTDLSLKNIL